MLGVRVSGVFRDGSVLVLATFDPARELVVGGGDHPMLAVADDVELGDRLADHGLRFTVSLGVPFVGLWWVCAFAGHEPRRVADLAVTVARSVWDVSQPSELLWCSRRLAQRAAS